MEGYIKFTAGTRNVDGEDHDGIEVDCNLNHIGIMEKLQLVKAMISTLDMCKSPESDLIQIAAETGLLFDNLDQTRVALERQRDGQGGILQ